MRALLGSTWHHLGRLVRFMGPASHIQLEMCSAYIAIVT